MMGRSNNQMDADRENCRRFALAVPQKVTRIVSRVKEMTCKQ